ncbi:sensor histidine kinase [Nocardioides sp. MAHUQ-72]|uniref:sensor histidine kinase n=1 Tax=unclassified Nocardioides TaxID=2615069 RepID=UPI003613E608
MTTTAGRCTTKTSGESEELLRLRRQLERERSRRIAAENIGEQATADLYSTVQQLRAAQAELVDRTHRLEELDRAKDAFVSNVSHELRTPLTSISGYLELMAEGALGEVSTSMARGIDVVTRNAARLTRLVEDLLTLSTYDDRGVRLELCDVDLAALVADCHRSLLPTLAHRSLDVALRQQAALPTIRADLAQVERVVLNLLTNATKFTHDGGRVTIDVEAGSRDTLALTVSDTGIGIPEAELGQVFSRFFRSSLSVAAEIQGTGLGLALTRTIVELHGGSVRLESVEGIGTTVTVVLPIDAQNQP